MEIYDAMSTLRAVRRIRPDPIPSDVLRRVLTAATWAPTGGNHQPWRMIAVQDAGLKQGMEDPVPSPTGIATYQDTRHISLQ